MPQTALSGQYDLPDNPIDAMLALAALGFRVFPAEPNGKRPFGAPNKPIKWSAFADQDPLPGFFEQCRKLDPAPNVALITSEHLVVIDLDNKDFIPWFDAQGPERIGTWVVRTQSGGLHVYLRSVEAVHTSVLKTLKGVKIGDVKARDAYVIAPPSLGGKGEYRTEYGTPEQIIEVDNARAWFIEQFADKYDATLPVSFTDRAVVARAGDDPEFNDHRVQGPPPVERQDALRAALREALVSKKIWDVKVYYTILEGADSPRAEGKWKNPDDRSGIDHGCLKDLINSGWTFQQIEEWWSFSPIGERYRERDSGHGYLWRTYTNAKAEWDVEQDKIKNAVGGNFKILPPAEKFEVESEAMYRFDIEWSTGPQVHHKRVTVPSVAFNTPQRFLDALARQGAHLDMGNFDSKERLRGLAFIVENLAEEAPVPEEATVAGRIAARVRIFVEAHTPPNPGISEGVVQVRAWHDGTHVYVSPDPLIEYVGALRPSPKLGDVWSTWIKMGGAETVKNGKRWFRAPLKAFPGIVLA